jgi:hypothetical protein
MLGFDERVSGVEEGLASVVVLAVRGNALDECGGEGVVGHVLRHPEVVALRTGRLTVSRLALLGV